MASGDSRPNGQGAFYEPMGEAEELRLETRLRARKAARAKTKITSGRMRAEFFKEEELDRRELLNAFGSGVCPINLNDGAEFTRHGLKTPPKYVGGHFVTKELSLNGILLATHTGDTETLRSPLWQLIAEGFGGIDKLRSEFVLFNICSIEAGFDQGKNLKKLLPEWAWDLAEELLVEGLNYCGPPERACSFGAPARDWFSPQNRERLGLWVGWTGKVHGDSPHVSLLYNPFFNRGNVSEKWIDDFGAMCVHMGGDPAFTDVLKDRIRQGAKIWGAEASEVYRLWKNKRNGEGMRASWVDPDTYYGSPEWRENKSKALNDMYADPEKGPKARENMSKALKIRKAKGGCSSRFEGVHLHKASGKWLPRITIAGKQVHVGSYSTEEDAARAYDAALMTVEGSKPASRNFSGAPVPTPAEIDATRAMLAAKAAAKGGSSKFKGVYLHKPSGKWVARITIAGKQVHLGSYSIEEDAARAYEKKATRDDDDEARRRRRRKARE